MKRMWDKLAVLLLSLCTLLMGCVEELENDTGALVQSMNNMDKNTASIAQTLEKLQVSADNALTNMNARVEQFEDSFNKGFEIIEKLPDSLPKLNRLFDMVDYVKEMANTMGDMKSTFDKIDMLADEISVLMESLEIQFDPKETESLDQFFDEDDFAPVEDPA